VNSILVAVVTFACSFGGAILGMLLRRTLPEQHLGRETKEVVQLGMGLVAAMAALVLGLLVASAMDAFDKQQERMQELSANVVLLDAALAHYGPETREARMALRDAVEIAIKRIWPDPGAQEAAPRPTEFQLESESLFHAIRGLAPTTEIQRNLQTQALSTISELAKTRWLLTHPDNASIPLLFLAILIFWMFILFVSFGLFSPANPTAIITLLVCALSVAGAMLMIIDLDQPAQGMVRVSDVPLRSALKKLGE
jgi:hypothetical protein